MADDPKKIESHADTNFFYQAKYGKDSRYDEMLVDATDAYANNLKYRIGFYHVPSGKTVYFKAFITSYKEDFINDWKGEQVFGRTDDIYTYGGTKRKITLSFDVPAASESEAYENMGRIQRLIQFNYPAYTNMSDIEYVGRYVVAQSPLVRINVMNLIQSPEKLYDGTEPMKKLKKMSRRDLFADYGSTTSVSESGLLCAINTIGLDTDMGKHAVFEKSPGTVLPQFFSVNIDFFVIHENTLGWDQNGNAMMENYPWDVWLKEPTEKEALMTEQNTAARTNMLLNNQAAADMAKARYSGLGGRRRAKKDIKRYARRENKGKASAQEGGIDYELASQAADAFKENDWKWGK